MECRAGIKPKEMCTRLLAYIIPTIFFLAFLFPLFRATAHFFLNFSFSQLSSFAVFFLFIFLFMRGQGSVHVWGYNMMRIRIRMIIRKKRIFFYFIFIYTREKNGDDMHALFSQPNITGKTERKRG